MDVIRWLIYDSVLNKVLVLRNVHKCVIVWAEDCRVIGFDFELRLVEINLIGLLFLSIGSTQYS